MLSPSTLFRAARRLVAPKTISADDQPSDRPLRPTAYLDGLRGFAAFLVYWHHHELWAHIYAPGRTQDVFENSWGRNGEYHLATFYGTRLFFTGGHTAVATFYVISGYVLTFKALQLTQNGQHARVADVVASALFRRWFRLYIPVLVTTFALITSWHLFGIWNSQIELKPTYAAEVWNWYTEFKNLSFIFKEGPMWPSYNGHLWSIPLEMRGSIITYVAALTLSRATTKARLLCEAGLAFYFMYICDAWYASVFMTGMLQCDLDLLARRSEPNSGFPTFLRRLEPYKKTVFYTLLVLALFFSGVPSHSRDLDEWRSNPGWYYLYYLKPQAVFDAKWFFLAIAANCLVAAIPRIPALKRFFEGRFCQYLGRISFSLYLVHGPILLLLGDRLYHAVGFVAPFLETQQRYSSWINKIPLPIAGPLGLEPAFLLPHIIMLPLTLWVSDVVTRHVDEPAVRFSQWLWNSIQQPKEQNGHASSGLRMD
ncbi:acyltransferase 3 [Coniella lustricola]|uniref:Acyltransferase 3 n=1 Tax=Coniella lustricola TaxID=2025994 RepID=A0A2T3A5X3_9PEZI|nr:acyltransferase 3 [Coniella lustricola]